MGAYIIRRLLLIIPTMFLVTMFVFGVMRAVPGNVIDLMVSEMAYQAGFERELTADWIRQRLGLDVPVYVQYGRWVGGLVRGDFGESLWTGQSINEELGKRLPISGELGIIGIALAVIIALPIGVYSAIRQDTAGDYLGRTIAILAISLPSFWIGTMVMVYPAIYLGWSPPVEYIPLVKDPAANMVQFLIPAVILGALLSGTQMRMTRTMMLEVLRQDYIRTAWAKGLNERAVIMRHAMKNAMIPVITIIGMLIPFVVAGEVVLETIFALPGIGLYMIEALNKRDYPIVSAINVVVAFVVLLINLFIDIAYSWLDPRVVYK